MQKGIILTLLSAVFYGFMPILSYLTFGFGNDPITLTFFKFFFVVPVLAGIMIYKKISFKITRIEFIKLFFLSIFGALMTALLLNSSYKYIQVGTSTALHFLYPVIIMIISKYFFKDIILKQQKISIFLSIVGILFFIDIGDLLKIQGLFLAILSGFTYGFFVLFIEKWQLSTMNNFKFAFFNSLIIVLFMLIFNSFLYNINFELEVNVYVIMLIISLLTSFLGVIFLKQGIDILGAKIASIICVLEPITAFVFGVIILNDAILLQQLFGALFIVLSILTLNMNQTNFNKK